MALSNLIKTIQNIMRKDTGVDGDAQRISQLTWMLFLKIFDDKESEYELLDSNYKSPIPEELRWRNWAVEDTGITGDELIDFINEKLFPGLKNMSWQKGDDPKGFIVKEIFQDSYNYMKSGTLMRQVINVIDNEIDFNNSKQTHIFNDIYEKILKDLQSAGNAGEYYTPRAVTKFVVEMVDPQLGDKILDPACGTGGFLIDSLEHIRNNQVKTPEEEKLLQNSIYGTEKKPLPHMLVMTNLILHGIEAPLNVRRGNSLANSIRDITQKDRVDVVITNPPFGGIEQDMIKKGFPTQFQTSETADLFLIMIIELLKSGGKAGIVLPDGSLTGDGVKARIREKLITDCNLHTIVRLPNSVFAPYATVATNLLFFTKGESTKEVWYYEHTLPEGQKSYSKTKTINFEEFKPIQEWWIDRKESEVSWKVTIDDLQETGFNLDIKNPNKKEDTIEFTSAELIKKLEDSFADSRKLLEEIKKEL
ncbi:MAG TPA: class I SAM-dependent DNA methyltransferase [Candidatus Dojkabacteria bacterium]|nr:class I SAM-dependent DNA methyltransferase [Candidatus Dojkabacteria bacterium]HRO64934.1 class I SAM-dependent DNA methyltransferase [Candidatus Dojkabacteria bacterium]HRP51331.1 class I SAM-dependent DNA methyltransferase [Candidatus Dojkabacteria bacterium]